MNKIMGRPYVGGNPSFARGNGVEAGLDAWFSGKSFKEASEIGEAAYDCDDKKYISHVVPMLEKAIEHFDGPPYNGEYPISGQEPFSCNVAGWKLIGYLDYRWPFKIVTDLKTSAQTPRGLNLRYKIQGTVYGMVYEQHAIEFVFVVATKTPKVVSITLTEDDKREAMPYVMNGIRGITSFYDRHEGIPTFEECAALVREFAPSPDDFFNLQEREYAMNLFGLNDYRHHVQVTDAAIDSSEKTIHFQRLAREKPNAFTTGPSMDQPKKEEKNETDETVYTGNCAFCGETETAGYPCDCKSKKEIQKLAEQSKTEDTIPFDAKEDSKTESVPRTDSDTGHNNPFLAFSASS